jgi:hypothetical protein
MTGILITVAAMDLAQLILAASEKQPAHADETAIKHLISSAEELLKLRKDLMEVLAVQVASDVELVELVQQYVQQSDAAATWTCPNCTATVANSLLVCPTCVPDDEPATHRGLQPVPEPYRCPAHGEATCGLCRLNPSTCDTPGTDIGCATYNETGMHWDTCPNRVVKVTGAGAWVLLDERVIGPQDAESAQPVQDALLLVGVAVGVEEVNSWTPEQRNEAVTWAFTLHVAASDNPVEVPRRPVFLPAEARHADRSESPMVRIDEHGQAHEYTLSDLDGQEVDRG